MSASYVNMATEQNSMMDGVAIMERMIKIIMDENKQNLTPEEYKSYNRLQMLVVIADNIFCTAFVLCITALACKTGNYKLMWFYLMPLMAYLIV